MTARTVLVQGGAGSVGVCAGQLARRRGALVIPTVRSIEDDAIARKAGAHHIVQFGPGLVDGIRAVAASGVDHIVEVAFGANIKIDLEVLALRGSIAAFATDVVAPAIPFWPLLFKNIRIDFLGSDDFTPDQKAAGARAVSDALYTGWSGFEIAERFPLDQIVAAHPHVEVPRRRGRVNR